MSRIWTIAKREYLSYFKSSMGWVIFAIYSVVTGLYFSYMLRYNYVDASAVLSFISGIYFVIIPIITMRTFAVENKNKTNMIYATSSISTNQLVWGKYLGVVLMFLTISSVNLLYLFTTRAFNGLIDIRYWGTLIAYLLTGFAYLAIGVFTSSLTESQVTSAIVSFVIFVSFEIFGSISTMVGSAVTSLINNLDFADKIPANTESNIGKAITDGMNWLNPSTKLAGFYEGTFDMVSVVYFISVIALFLYITAHIIDSARWRK